MDDIIDCADDDEDLMLFGQIWLVRAMEVIEELAEPASQFKTVR